MNVQISKFCSANSSKTILNLFSLCLHFQSTWLLNCLAYPDLFLISHSFILMVLVWKMISLQNQHLLQFLRTSHNSENQLFILMVARGSFKLGARLDPIVPIILFWPWLSSMARPIQAARAKGIEKLLEAMINGKRTKKFAVKILAKRHLQWVKSCEGQRNIRLQDVR